MQILIQVVLVKDTPSLRASINKDAKDAKLGDYGLKLDSTKKVGRPEGWTKLHSSHQGASGAINVEWESNVRLLMCRVTTKGSEMPDRIIGDFVQYLFARFGKDIESINIIKRG